jgi:hypothetical protein
MRLYKPITEALNASSYIAMPYSVKIPTIAPQELAEPLAQ